MAGGTPALPEAYFFADSGWLTGITGRSERSFSTDGVGTSSGRSFTSRGGSGNFTPEAGITPDGDSTLPIGTFGIVGIGIGPGSGGTSGDIPSGSGGTKPFGKTGRPNFDTSRSVEDDGALTDPGGGSFPNGRGCGSLEIGFGAGSGAGGG